MDYSETESASSSGLGNYDVAIFCHISLTALAEEIEKQLLEDYDMTACLSCRDPPAGRLELSNLYSIANRSKTKIFILSDDLVKDGFKRLERILSNETVCSKSNSLIVLKKHLDKSVPGYLRDIPLKFLSGHLSASDVVRLIVDFRDLVGRDCHDCSSEFEIESSQSEGDGTPALSTTSLMDPRENQQFDNVDEGVKFKQLFGKISEKRCYVLITSPIRQRSPSLQHVTCVPWVRVFDFDTKGCSDGLLLWAEEELSKKNTIRTDRADQVDPLDEKSINWVSILSSEFDCQHSKDVTIPEQIILSHGESLADYCVGRKVPVILVMWYPINSNLDKALDSFLTGLRHHLKGRLNSFRCIVCVREKPNKKTPFYHMLTRLGITENTMAIPVDILCNWLRDCRNSSSYFDPSLPLSTKTLPKFMEPGGNISSVDIKEEDLAWIRSQFYLLVQNHPSSDDPKSILSSVDTLGKSFLCGSRIPWPLLSSGGYDVRRDLLDKAKEYILTKHIDVGKSGLITLYHAPGGGGTTFARRLLYELHERVPCGELTSDRLVWKSLEERLVSLRNLTNLPIVLMLDGNKLHDVQKVLAMSTTVCIILIHVRRYLLESGKNATSDDKIFLKAKVSRNEAENFYEVYSKAAPGKQGSLKGLTRKILRDETHYIFEYGMTAFQSKFVGVRSYVHGYLQVHNNELKNWHTVLVFLSLANYYGHRGLPSKLFSKILDIHENETVELDSDLPHEAAQFITEDGDSWKITHFIVSNLILEQVLVRRHTTDYNFRENRLSVEAREQICKWASCFIDNITKYVGMTKKLVPYIWEILTAIFIRRNYDDPGNHETDYKTPFSKIIEDIEQKSKQETLFKKLVECFPGRADFRAHLGRFYSKQSRFDEAQECFEKALQVRKQENSGQDRVYVHSRYHEQQKADDVLERVYNMSGFAYLSRIRNEIGTRIGQLSWTKLKNKNLPHLIRLSLENAQKAIKSFDNGRLYYQKTSNPSFANLGELKVRLQLTELAKHVSRDNFAALLGMQPPYKNLGEFVLQSFHGCDMLLAQCISDRSRQIDVPEGEINYCFNNFNFFYKNATAALERWAGDDSSIHSMKCHLSILKTKLRQSNKSANHRKHFKLNDDVQNQEEIQRFVLLCESICDKGLKKGVNIRISSYMHEWLRAIRHRCMKKKYPLIDILSRIEKWKERKENGSLANFYCYVVTTTISITSVSRETANIFADKSRQLKDYMRQNDHVSQSLPDNNEWLGKDDIQDFRKLIHFTEMGEWNGKFLTSQQQIARLQVYTGSILFCRPHDGIIALDGSKEINVFFVPQKYNIGFSHSKRRTRMEFYLAFNTRHFLEAYEVTPLKKYPCPSCQTPTEIPTLGKDPNDLYNACNFCETLVHPS